jgi:hypothetical protein
VFALKASRAPQPDVEPVVRTAFVPVPLAYEERLGVRTVTGSRVTEIQRTFRETPGAPTSAE